jgi:Uma2 family endonuclease
MATVTTSSASTPPNGRLFTIADVDKLPRELPSGPVDYELDNGRIVTMSPTGNRHSAVQTRISSELVDHGDKKGLGETRVEVGVVLWRNPDRLVGPDVAFFSKKSFPLNESVEGYLETIPELVFEVRSKNDTEAEIRRKVADYLAAGVKQVFNVDPETKTISLHRVGQALVMLGETDILKLDETIPDCSLSLAELFRP